ncbi:MAG: hypothetical protein ACREIV_08030, partial [Planctomycetaceae bacterium]
MMRSKTARASSSWPLPNGVKQPTNSSRQAPTPHPLAARIFHVAHDAEIYNRIGGPATAVAIARRRAGRLYDPTVAERFAEVAPSLFHQLEAEPIWEAVLAAEPAPMSPRPRGRSASARR